jgi:hypothetical protein
MTSPGDRDAAYLTSAYWEEPAMSERDSDYWLAEAFRLERENERLAAALKEAETKMAHVCAESRDCCCSTTALEPNEDCPRHGAGPWPIRCGECGKFLPWSVRGGARDE